MRSLLCALLALAATTSASSQTSLATNSPTPLSTRVVAYTLDAKIDTDKKALDASETLTYKNLTGQPLTSFPFHLYLNAFRPESTFTSETHFGGGIRDQVAADAYPDKKRGSILISSLSADGFGDLAPRLRFAAPDDGNANDHTVAVVTLPHPLAPGDSITFHMRFHDQFPESVARNGYKRDFLMGGQWFPKVGVFSHGQWNCHQYHATTEFFSDFGTYDVRLTLPQRFTVGASGVPTLDRSNPDGTQTHAFYAEDVIDFAWAASPNFTVTTGTYLGSMGPVQVRVLALRAHPQAGERYLKILLGSLDQFDRRYGPYPYKILTLVDPEPGSEIGGMEYPTLITGETFNFDISHITEITAEHEFGHQYWYGMVATNEFEDAWLDEGINSYTETVVTGALLGQQTSFFDRPWANLSDTAEQYATYIGDPAFDPVTRHAWQFRNAGSYGGITYGKSATLLHQLEGLIGKDTMDEAMRTYFMRFRFQHPTTEDFLTTIEQVAIARGRAQPQFRVPQVPNLGLGLSAYHVVLETQPIPNISVGSSLRPFFNQAIYGTAILDYAIDSIHSGPAEWWNAKPFASAKDTVQRDTVSVHRLGDFRTPVTVEVTFTDGTKVREQWSPDDNQDTNDRWHTWTYLRKAEIKSAEVDPDRDRFNNSYTIVTNPIPARKVATLYSTSLQFLTQIAGWLI